MGAPWQPQPAPRPAKAPSRALTLTHQHLPGMSVVAVAGELDRTNSAKLAEYLDRVHRPGDHVVFDLTELAFLDSSGLHVLLARARACAAEGTGMHLAGASGAPARLLTITGVDGHLPVYAAVQEAITTVLAIRRG
ncbi:MAG TPA: STAS domain-containing protein [Nonomuraea sp.]|nr:STAS domain-containing protein [Nonomuraea sp.]